MFRNSMMLASVAVLGLFAVTAMPSVAFAQVSPVGQWVSIENDPKVIPMRLIFRSGGTGETSGALGKTPFNWYQNGLKLDIREQDNNRQSYRATMHQNGTNLSTRIRMSTRNYVKE
jgi:hypothetical protein